MTKKIALLSLIILIILAVPSRGIEASWNPSYIISDIEFTAKNTMTEADIQAFLESKGNYLESYIVPEARYVEWQGVNYYENDKIGPFGAELDVSGWKASKVIYYVAQWYNINPQAILATIQKESSLVTTYPAYYGLVQWSMGYAYTEGGILNVCNSGTNDNPTGSCAGFAMQVDWGGGMLAHWANNGGHYLYPVGSTKYIDGIPTYIGNAATSVLYAYTPHFHGNQNFRYFYDIWFVPYTYDFISAINPPTISNNGSYYTVQIKIKNSGALTWQNDTSNPLNPTRLFVSGNYEQMRGTTGWYDDRRIVMTESEVASGQTATFNFNVKTPETPGRYEISFQPIVEGISAMGDQGLKFVIYTRINKTYRFYNIYDGNHFLTTSEVEYLKVLSNQSFRYEGVAFYADIASTLDNIPVYRFFNLANGDRLYTTNYQEVLVLRNNKTWRDEGVVYFSYKSKPFPTSPLVNRFFSKVNGKHFFTANPVEINSLKASPDWIFEGETFQVT